MNREGGGLSVVSVLAFYMIIQVRIPVEVLLENNYLK